MNIYIYKHWFNFKGTDMSDTSNALINFEH